MTVDNVFEKAKKVCEECEIEDDFPEKRKKRVKRHDLSESSDDGYDITSQQSFKINMYEAFDKMISEFTWRFEKLYNIHHVFNFLTIEQIGNYPAEAEY